MARDYWIDVVYPRKHHTVGDYEIIGDLEILAKKYNLNASFELAGPRRHHHSGGPRYWELPIYYVPDFGDVAVNTMYSDPTDIPDAVQGPLDVNQAWYRPRRDVVKEFTSHQRRIPTIAEINTLKRYVSDIKKNMAASDEWSFEHNNGRLDWFITYARVPNRQEDSRIAKAAEARVNQHIRRYHDTHKTIGDLIGDIVHGINDDIQSVPIAGPLIHGAINLNPVTAIGNMSARMLNGERIDHAFLDTAKEQVRAVKEVAPYVKTVMSFVPGVGTGVAAAIAAGTALAEGRSITDAVLDGLGNAVPGGSLGKTLFHAATAIVHGDKVSDVVLNEVKNQLPANLRPVIDTAVGAAQGKNVREAVLQAIRANVPDSVKKALDVGVATGVARNAQAAVVNALSQQAALAKLATLPLPQLQALQQLAKFMPSNSQQQRGFKIAAQLVSHRGVTPMAVAAARRTVNIHERAGFDHAIKTIKHLRNPQHTSLVRGGIVTRGNWRPAKPHERGTHGRLVQGGHITVGNFVRV